MNYRNLNALFILFVCPTLSGFAQIEGNFTLPQTWKEDFVITFSYHGSMRGGRTEVKFTFDSCMYMNQSSHSERPKMKTRKLKEADRAAILKKLTELKADKIKSEGSVRVVHDGWSQSICFGSYCIAGGTSAEMSEDDKNQFLEVSQYLEETAMKITKIK